MVDRQADRQTSVRLAEWWTDRDRQTYVGVDRVHGQAAEAVLSGAARMRRIVAGTTHFSALS